MKKLILVLVFAVGCGSVEKTAFNGLIGLKAAYVTANGARNEYCAPKNPAPPICKDSKPVLQTAYDTLLKGVDLLATYTENKTAGVKAELQALIPKFTEIALQLIQVEAKFK